MKQTIVIVSLLLILSVSCVFSADLRFANFLKNNLDRTCSIRGPVMPMSYLVPNGYYNSIPPNDRIAPNSNAQAGNVPDCGGFVPKSRMQDYEFQTEEIVTTYGLNIYDGAIWMIANGIMGNHQLNINYVDNIMKQQRTCEWQGIEGDAPCKGVIVENKCSGDCGLCYGDGSKQSLRKPFAWYFKTLSETYAFKKNYDARCPEKKITFKWNNWIPVLGENSWARLIGPLQASYLRYGSVAAMPVSDLSISLDFVSSLKQMVIPSIGAIYYAPHNTYGAAKAKGETISVENQASTLAGLLMLRSILVEKNTYTSVIKDIDYLSSNIERYIKNAYDSKLGYIRQGGYWIVSNKTYVWEDILAVDCQTWTMTVLGSEKIDSWFGHGTAQRIWTYTKAVAGYKFDGTFAQGLGFDSNANRPVDKQVFSGEWTFGAINLLKLFITENNGYDNAPLQHEVNLMRNAINTELTRGYSVNGVQSDAVLYANRRYWIPFGWWSNPIPSLASTGWAAIVDNNYNPLYLGGAFKTYSFV